MGGAANNYAFIDTQNVILGVKKGLGWELDFQRFRVYLRDKYHISKAFLFLGYLKRNDSWYQVLRGYGYELVCKPVVERTGGEIKGNVDAELVLHAMLEFPNYAKAVIVTSDGDFHCLVEYLRQQSKLERLLIPNRMHFSSLYRKLMPQLHFMNGLEGKLARC